MKKQTTGVRELAARVKLDGHSFLVSELKKFGTVEKLITEGEKHWFEGTKEEPIAEADRVAKLRAVWDMAFPPAVDTAAAAITAPPAQNTLTEKPADEKRASDKKVDDKKV